LKSPPVCHQNLFVTEGPPTSSHRDPLSSPRPASNIETCENRKSSMWWCLLYPSTTVTV